MAFKKYEKYGSAPVGHAYFFLSEEKEKEFLEAPEAVQKHALSIIEACVRKNMTDINQGFILEALRKLEERIEALEKL
jgi:YHS domain-containing protein